MSRSLVVCVYTLCYILVLNPRSSKDSRSMISDYELTRFVENKHRLIVELLARGILDDSLVCKAGRIHHPSVTLMEFRCRCFRVNRRRSIYNKSFFENARLPIATIFRIAHSWLNDEQPCVCACRLSVSRNTVGRYYGYFRQLSEASLGFAPVRVGGIGVCVEIDEMFVKRDPVSDKEVWVIGAVERTPEKRLHLSILKSKTPEDIVYALSEAILPGSLLVTDFLPSYSQVAQTLNLPHTRVNKSRSFVDSSTKMHTNHIEATWKHLRRFLGRRSRVKLDVALAEFVWRRENAQDIWEGFLKSLAKVDWS